MQPLSIVRQWVAPYVGESGKNEADPDVLIAINEARRIIYPLGNWVDTIDDLVIQLHDEMVTLPYWADVIIGSWHNGQVIPIQNSWYHRVGADFHRFRGYCCDKTIINLGDKFASFRDATRPFRIEVIPQDDRDAGTVMNFHAIDEYCAPVLLTRTLQTAWVPITSDPANDRWVKRFTYCEKPKTFDRVQVFMWDAVRNIRELCAVYEGPEINPSYRRYRIMGNGRARHRGGAPCHQIIAQVKKKYVDLSDDRELVDIHTDALIHLLQAITARKNRDPQTYAAQVKSARDFLDKEIEAKNPVQATTFKMSTAYTNTNLGFGYDGYDYPCSRF